MFLKSFFALLLFVEITLSQTTIRKNPLLSRKKRYLAFPEGSNFVITLSGISNFLRRPTPGIEWKWLAECDFPFPLPDATNFLKKKKMHLKQRREIYRGLEHVLNGNGFNGSACINRMICEAQHLAQERGTSLVKNILYAIFSYPGAEDEIYGGTSCGNYSASDCEIPLLDYVIGALSAN